MTAFSVSLTSITDVKTFVDAAAQTECEIDVCSGRYIVNAKSIMGLFSIDLSQPIRVEVQGDESQGAAFREKVAAFVVEG